MVSSYSRIPPSHPCPCRFPLVTRLLILLPQSFSATSSVEDRLRSSPPVSIWSPDSSTNHSIHIHRVSSFDDGENDNLSTDSSNPPILRVFSFDDWSSNEQADEEPIQFSRRAFSFDFCFDDGDDNDELYDDLLRSKAMTAPTVLDEKDASSVSFVQVIGPTVSRDVGKSELVPLDVCTWSSSSRSSAPRTIYHCDSIPRCSDPADAFSTAAFNHSNSKSLQSKSFQVSQNENCPIWRDDLTSISSVSTMSASTPSASGNTIPNVIVVSNDQQKSMRGRLEWGRQKP